MVQHVLLIWEYKYGGINNRANISTTELLDTDLKPTLTQNKRKQVCLLSVTLSPVLGIIDMIENK